MKGFSCFFRNGLQMIKVRCCFLFLSNFPSLCRACERRLQKIGLFQLTSSLKYSGDSCFRNTQTEKLPDTIGVSNNLEISTIGSKITSSSFSIPIMCFSAAIISVISYVLVFTSIWPWFSSSLSSITLSNLSSNELNSIPIFFPFVPYFENFVLSLTHDSFCPFT